MDVLRSEGVRSVSYQLRVHVSSLREHLGPGHWLWPWCTPRNTRHTPSDNPRRPHPTGRDGRRLTAPQSSRDRRRSDRGEGAVHRGELPRSNLLYLS